MKKLIFTAALFGASATGLFADTVAYLQSAGPTSQTDGAYAVSPYTGFLGVTASGGTTTNGTTTGATVSTVGATQVQLFCDDFPDHATFGQDWKAQVTAVTAAGSGSLTRFGSSNNDANTSSYPAGVALYEEIAWLFDQTANGNLDANNQIAVQEAVWHLTDGSGTPENKATTSGTDLSYLAWITAATNYSGISSGTTSKSVVGTTYQQADYSKWYVVTADNYTTAGSTQEFLAYNSAGTIHTTVGGTPEPATFVLFGSGLLAVGFLGRRRKQSNS